MAKKRHHSTISEMQVLRAVRLFRYITRFLLALFFYGSARRVKALEILLPKLEREGRLIVFRHKGQKVYSPARKNGVQAVSIEHELGWIEVLIRLWRCRMGESEIIPERAFRGFAIVVPESGIRYSKKRGTMLIVEFSTLKNFLHGVVKSKLTRYKKGLPDIEAKFQREITVLFVIDTDREKVKEFVERMRSFIAEPVISGFSGKARYPFFFIDFSSLKTIPEGKTMTTRRFYWHDGKEYPLSHD